MRRGDPVLPVRQAREKSHEEIVEKCHPAISELAAAYKELILRLNGLGENPPAEAVAALKAETQRNFERIDQKYQPLPQQLAMETVLSEEALTKVLTNNENNRDIIKWAHFERYGKSFSKDLKRMDAKDGRAARRILKTLGEYQALRCERKRPNRFKRDLEHYNMFLNLWEFGIENLSPGALADFFDDHCPCQADHDPDALRNQRVRFQKDVEAARGGS